MASVVNGPPSWPAGNMSRADIQSEPNAKTSRFGTMTAEQWNQRDEPPNLHVWQLAARRLDYLYQAMLSLWTALVTWRWTE